MKRILLQSKSKGLPVVGYNPVTARRSGTNPTVTTSSVGAQIEEAVPTKAAASRIPRYNEASSGINPVSFTRNQDPVNKRPLISRPKPLASRPAAGREAASSDIRTVPFRRTESFKASKKKPLPSLPETQATTNTATGLGFTVPSSNVLSGSTLPPRKVENRDHITTTDLDSNKFAPPKCANSLPPMTRESTASITAESTAKYRHANRRVKPQRDSRRVAFLLPIAEESGKVSARKVDDQGCHADTRSTRKREKSETETGSNNRGGLEPRPRQLFPSPSSHISPPQGHSNPRILESSIATNKELPIQERGTSKPLHADSRRSSDRPLAKPVPEVEPSRNPRQTNVESPKRPPRNPKRADQPLPFNTGLMKGRDIPTSPQGIPTPDSTPRKANGANRKGASTTMPIVKRPDTHASTEIGGSHVTHVEYPSEEEFEPGPRKKVDLTREAGSFHPSRKLKSPPKEGIYPKDEGLASGSAPLPPGIPPIESFSSVVATSGGSSRRFSLDSGRGESMYPSSSITSGYIEPPAGMRHPPSEGVDSKIVGQGSTAVVHRVLSGNRGRFRAVKVIYLRNAEEDDIAAHACEVSILQKLQKANAAARAPFRKMDPGIDRVFGGPEDRMELGTDGCLRITTDFYPTDLLMYQGIIKRDEEALLTVMVEIAQGLRYLHSLGIVHLDIKPENIFLTMNRHCVIGDYGGSIDYERKKNTFGFVFSTETTFITSGYAAPEVTVRDIMFSFFSYNADIWSLGVLIHDLIAPRFSREPAPGKPEQLLNYEGMGLYPKMMSKRMSRERAPESVMLLVLEMCEMRVNQRPTAADILNRIKERGLWPQPDSIDPSKPSPLLSYTPSPRKQAPRFLPEFLYPAEQSNELLQEWLEDRGYDKLPVAERPSDHETRDHGSTTKGERESGWKFFKLFSWLRTD
ncbi:hypothetical protein M413DRAFT_31205 [Hebeloma cylindrosporum]|uniref:Protein kinase domain-containing protein n=1 Tax=Hebeloma cylindrosporum TaxID=76867 RepID=A0A0C3BJY4_HEBCY|nr:hypothetical protein M413DRAFT_31205 [Hebeloma cylindrosporum h7]